MPLLRNGAFVAADDMSARIKTADHFAEIYERHQRHDLANPYREKAREYREILAEFHAEINGDAA